MKKETKNQTVVLDGLCEAGNEGHENVVLKKVVLKNVDAVVVGVAGTKDDKRKSNPGRPVNKQSARYKRLAKQSFYTSQLSKFEKGNQFEYKSCKYSYVCNDDGLGYICDGMNNYVCAVKYIGRTKVLGVGSVLDKLVKVEINLKQVRFVK